METAPLGKNSVVNQRKQQRSRPARGDGSVAAAMGEESRVSLGEGFTPLLPIDFDVAGLNVLLKNETANQWSG
jgi:hypothetical protein